MGATKQAKGRGSGRQRRQAPLRTPQRQGQPATSPSRAPQVPQTPAEPVPQAVQGRGAGGGSPRRNKLLVSPFHGGEERSASAVGGIGGKNKAKGRVGRRQRRQAPPPPDTVAAWSVGSARGKPPAGCGITLPCPTKKEKIHCRRKIARTPCALPPNMLY